jgi:hypothetical protein
MVEPAAPQLSPVAAITPDAGWVHIAATAATQVALTQHCGTLLSVAHIVPCAAAKVHLGQRSGALAVDMESYSVGRVAAEHHLPFVTLRTIFDTCDDDVAFQTDRFTTPDGVLQPGRLGCYLVRSPQLLIQTPSFWRKARRARNHLENWLHCFLTLLGQDA